MIALGMWMSAAHAVPVLRQVNMCVDYDVQFSDAPDDAQVDGIGDHWDNNSIDRAGITLAWEVVTDLQTHSGRLDTAGCMTTTIQLSSAKYETFDFAVYSNTNRRGVSIQYRFNDSPRAGANGPEYHWEDGTEQRMEWTNRPITNKLGVTHDDVLLVAEDGWQFLAVATWIIHRNKWNLHVPNVRECCLGSAASPDGSCSDLNARYKRDIDPYLVSQPKLFIQGEEDAGSGGPNRNCCGSKIFSTTAPPNQGGQISGFRGGVDEQARYVIAHELGHVLVGVRMGGWEYGMYPSDADLNSCMGTFRSQDTSIPLDVDFPSQDTTKGTFTKEYMSMAAREGWANWVSSWTWNVKGQSDCEFKYFTYQDFDLDDDVDNYFGSGHRRNGSMDCLGTPELFQAVPSDPTDAFLGSTNWLEDVLDEEVCDPFVGDVLCGNPALMESINRSTLYDWQKMRRCSTTCTRPRA